MFKNLIFSILLFLTFTSSPSFASFENPSKYASKYPTDRPMGTPTYQEAQAQADEAQIKADQAKKEAEEAQKQVERINDTNSYKALERAQAYAERMKQLHKEAQELADSLKPNKQN